MAFSEQLVMFYLVVFRYFIRICINKFVLNVGGQLGLYLGASFLTFFELIEFAGNTLIGFYKLRKEQKLVYDSSHKI